MPTKKDSVKKVSYHGTGRRKRSVAQVIITAGSGEIIVNQKKAIDFFPYEILVKDLKQPLVLTNTEDKFDVFVKVSGGGFSGQAGATRLGIARALLNCSPSYREILKPAKMLTRDSRIKERKKYGLKKARRAPQFSKR